MENLLYKKVTKKRLCNLTAVWKKIYKLFPSCASLYEAAKNTAKNTGQPAISFIIGKLSYTIENYS